MTRIRSRRIVGALAVGLSLAACGGSSPNSSTTGSATSTTDPASAVPASAVLYAQAVVRPSGPLAAGIDAGAKKLIGIANPGAMIDAAIDSAIKTPHLSYEATIRPWPVSYTHLPSFGHNHGPRRARAYPAQTSSSRAQATMRSPR